MHSGEEDQTRGASLIVPFFLFPSFVYLWWTMHLIPKVEEAYKGEREILIINFSPPPLGRPLGPSVGL